MVTSYSANRTKSLNSFCRTTFIPKPFGGQSNAVLISGCMQLRSIGRRVYAFDKWVVNIDERIVTRSDGVTVPMGDAEFRLLVAFVLHPRHVLSRNQLLDLADSKEADLFDRSIDNRVLRLRRKMEDDPAEPVFIKTVRSGGYVFMADVRKLP